MHGEAGVGKTRLVAELTELAGHTGGLTGWDDAHDRLSAVLAVGRGWAARCYAPIWCSSGTSNPQMAAAQ